MSYRVVRVTTLKTILPSLTRAVIIDVVVYGIESISYTLKQLLQFVADYFSGYARYITRRSDCIKILHRRLL